MIGLRTVSLLSSMNKAPTFVKLLPKSSLQTTVNSLIFDRKRRLEPQLLRVQVPLDLLLPLLLELSLL